MSTEPGKPTRYRFRVRGPDGKELVSDTFSHVVPVQTEAEAAANQVTVHLQVEDDDGHPHVSRPFEIKVRETVIKGTTSPTGVINVKVPKGAEAALTIHGTAGVQNITVAMGNLSPADQLTGAQERLQSMGYSCRPTGKLDDATRQAIIHFQHDHKLPAKGAFDAAIAKSIDDSYRATH